jgi:hypothetical protein
MLIIAAVGAWYANKGRLQKASQAADRQPVQTAGA